MQVLRNGSSAWTESLTSSGWLLLFRRPLWPAGTWWEIQGEECGLFTDRHFRIWVSDTRKLWEILAQPTTGTRLDYTWETRLDANTHMGPLWVKAERGTFIFYRFKEKYISFSLYRLLFNASDDRLKNINRSGLWWESKSPRCEPSESLSCWDFHPPPACCC